MKKGITVSILLGVTIFSIYMILGPFGELVKYRADTIGIIKERLEVRDGYFFTYLYQVNGQNYAGQCNAHVNFKCDFNSTFAFKS